MKIYTKKGDQGKTSLLGGERVLKHHLRIEAYGTIDELNAHLGLLHDYSEEVVFKEEIKWIQQQLFLIGSYLATVSEKVKLPAIPNDLTTRLENTIDLMENQLPALTNFVLPGGYKLNAYAHICRTICRRAERVIVGIHEEDPVKPEIMKFINRLSDWLFVYARYVSFQAGREEIKWLP